MWVYWVVVFIAALLYLEYGMPKPRQEKQRAAELGDFQFPRSNEGDPVGLVWGTVRIKSPNTIWYGDLTAYEMTAEQKVGMWSSKRVQIGFKYFFGLDLVICLGPNVTLKKIWAGKYLAWSGSLATESSFVLNQPELFGGEKQGGGMHGEVWYYPGSFTQNRDPYLAIKCDPNVPRYGGVAHVVFKNFYFGTRSQLETLNFEVTRLSDIVSPGYGIMPNGLDVNPMEILYDALTSDWGRLGIPTTMLDTASWQSVAQTLYAESNGMSIKLDSSVTGKKIAEEVLRQADGIIYQDPETEKIVAKLFRQDYVIGNLPILTADQISELTSFSKSTWDSTFNQCRANFPNRSMNYENSVAMAQDFANINFQQKTRSTEMSFPGCTDPTLAQQLATRALSVYSVPLYKCDLKVSREASFLRPGELFILNWEPYGIEQMVMRVKSIDLGAFDAGTISITCIQDQFASNDVLFSPPQPSSWVNVDNTAKQITTRKIIEAPKLLTTLSGYELDNTSGCLYILARKPSGTSIHFDAESTLNAFTNTYLSLDDAQYTPSAQLMTGYVYTEGGTSRYDTTVGITITAPDDLTYLQQSANRSSTTDGTALFVVNNEIMSYRTYVDNGNGTYTLQGISRGFLDTIPATHSTGDYIYFLPGQNGLTNTVFADTASVTTRLRDNTPVSTLATSLALTDVVTLDRRAYRPAPATYIQVNGSRVPAPLIAPNSITVTWRERTRLATGIVWYDDATQTPEAGTTYRIRYRIGAGSYTTVSGIAVSNYTVNTVGLEGVLEVEVYAERSGLLSRVGDTIFVTLYPNSGFGYAFGEFFGGTA